MQNQKKKMVYVCVGHLQGVSCVRGGLRGGLSGQPGVEKSQVGDTNIGSGTVHSLWLNLPTDPAWLVSGNS